MTAHLNFKSRYEFFLKHDAKDKTILVCWVKVTEIAVINGTKVDI